MKPINTDSEVNAGVESHRKALSEILPGTANPLPSHESEGSCVVPTGIPAVDFRIQGGLWSGELAILCALTGGGKSSFCVHLASVAASFGVPVLFVYSDMSMSVCDYNPRFLAWVTGQSYGDISRGGLIDNSVDCSAFERLNFMDFTKKTNWISRLRTGIEQLKGENDRPPLVLIDSMDGLSSYERCDLDATSSALSNMAKSCNVPIWATIQANDGASDVDVLSLECVRDSRARAFPASFVFGLGMSEDACREGIATLTALKARRAKRFFVRLKADFAIQRFTELSQAYDVDAAALMDSATNSAGGASKPDQGATNPGSHK